MLVGKDWLAPSKGRTPPSRGFTVLASAPSWLLVNRGRCKPQRGSAGMRFAVNVQERQVWHKRVLQGSDTVAARGQGKRMGPLRGGFTVSCTWVPQ